MAGNTYKTIERQGNISVLTEMTRANRHCRAKRLSKNEFVNLGTGEVKEYEHKEKRTQNKKSLYRTFSRIKALINTNATNPKGMRWITLTYAKPEKDPRVLYKDFKNFWGRLMTYHDKRGLPHPEYLTVVEPNEPDEETGVSERFHHHLILFYDGIAPFIPNEELEKIWRNGFTKITAVDENIDNIGAYLSAYLTDLLIPEQKGTNLPTVEVEGKKKSVIKGGRLDFYPPGMNIYRHSKGIKQPTKTVVSEKGAEAFRRENGEPYYTTERTYVDPKTGFETTIHKSFYKKKKRNDEER